MTERNKEELMMKAKTKITRLCSILLTLVMLVGLLPTTALAAEATATADFDADPVSALALLNAAKTGTVDSTWDSTNNTLTLNGVNFTTTADIAVKLPDGAIIELNGENTITGGNSASEGCYGIYAEGSLTIQGTGTLNVTGGNTTGTAGGSRSCGIYTNQALTISSGTVKAYAGTSAKDSLGIYSKGNFTISGTADVTAIGGTATGGGSFGIDAEGEVIISGGEVTAIGGTGQGSDGIYSGSSKVTINGGTVMAIGGVATGGGWSVGIYAFGGKVTINGGSVTSAANYKSSDYYTFKGSVTGNDIKTISFNSNGGSGSMEAKTTADNYTLPANGFTAPAGKQFKGWKVGSEIKAVGDTIDVSGSIPTVYAQWGDVEYAVTVTNGKATVGASTDAISKAEVDATVKLTADPAPDGQVFDKWVVESGGITLADATSATTTFTMPAKAVSVKATYKAAPLSGITITTPPTKTAYTAGESFDSTGMVVTATYSDSSSAAVTGYTVSPDRALTTSDTSVTISYTEGGVTKTATQEITVNPAASTYTVSFNANGGSVTPASAVTGADGKLTSLPTPTRSGSYSFNGWYTAASGGTKVDTNYIFSADTTIYAQWTYTGGGSGGGGTITAPVSDPKNQVKVTASVSGSTATVQKIDLSKIDQAQGVTIDFTGLGRTVESAKLPTSAIKEIGATESGALTVMLTAGNVTFDTAALKAVADQAGSQITLTLTPVKTSALNASQKETVGDAPVFDLRLLGGSKAITNFKGGNVTVTLPHTLSKGQEPAGVVVYYLSNDGNPEACKTTYDAKNKLVTFTTTHFSLYFVGYKQPASKWENPFTDVAEGAWYFDSVKYVHSEGMMVGTSATKFSPDATTTRSMIVTILYRLEGEPAVSGTSSFNDVAEGKYYANAVKWAAENEIVGGYGGGVFGPDDTITREQLAAILYRYAAFKGFDMTKTADLSEFTDSGKISGYAEAPLSWANAEGLINGKGGGILDPLGNATRAEVAVMLMRYCELEK